MKRVPWHCFWHPQSGIIGGTIAGAAVALAMLLTVFFRG
jgi:hypothetical protein